MKTDVQGCSTCPPGEERFEEFFSTVGYRWQYDFRTPDGRLFSCIGKTVEGRTAMNHSAQLAYAIRRAIGASGITGAGGGYRITITDTFGGVAEIRWNAEAGRWEDDDGSSEATLERLKAWREGLEGQ